MISQAASQQKVTGCVLQFLVESLRRHIGQVGRIPLLTIDDEDVHFPRRSDHRIKALIQRCLILLIEDDGVVLCAVGLGQLIDHVLGAALIPTRDNNGLARFGECPRQRSTQEFGTTGDQRESPCQVKQALNSWFGHCFTLLSTSCRSAHVSEFDIESNA